ncbi:MAG: hypothetical protein IJR82_03380 [Bacilli bacterium]|nr:hypothetical protein [Bacilli bacterium]
MKENLKKFNELRKDPKKKSIMLIILYGIFFTFVFIYVKVNQNQSTPIIEDNKGNEPVIQEKTDIVSGYEYKVLLEMDNNIINIEGTFYNNDQLFSINNKKYYLKNNQIYLSEDNTIVEKLDYPLSKLLYDNINKINKDYQYESKTEYKDNNIKYVYIISNEEIAKLFNEDITTNGNVIINIYKKDYIYKVEYDLSQYYGKNYQITIEYNHVNEITNLDIHS